MTGDLGSDRADCVQERESRESWYAVIRLDDATLNCWDHTSAIEVVDVRCNFVDALKIFNDVLIEVYRESNIPNQS